MAFDRRAGRLVALAEAADGVETWTFDVCTNAWMQMHPDREPPNAGELVYDADSDVTVGLIGSAEWSSAVWAYDLGTDTWTEKRGLAPTGARLRFYDPVSGLVVVTADDGDPDTPGPELWSYEVETDAWFSIRQANRLGSEPVALVYDTSVDRVVAYAVGDRSGEARTWLLDPRTGTWSGTRAETPELFVGGWFPQPAIAFDEAAGRTVVAGLDRAVAYDATADRWETLLDPAAETGPGACSTPECRSGHQMVYDAVNGRLFAYGGEAYTTCTWEAADDMWALDMVTRSWALILPPAPEPPPLRDLASVAPDSMGPDLSPWVRAAKATLHGGPFFTRVPGVADEPWSGTPPTEVASVADGLLVPECQGWTEGTVWWEETTSDPSSRAWVEIDLGGTFVLDAAVVQADVNDTYRLSYRDRQTSEWVPLWDVPFGEAGGMATRPEQGDASVRWPLPRPVVTDALRFEATAGDYQYSVSEIAVFGLPAP